MTNESARLNLLLTNGCIELRCFDSKSEMAIKKGKKIIWSGVFDNYKAIVKAIKFCLNLDMDIYNTFNPSSKKITNEIKPFQRATHDEDITRITWLPFDIDVPEKDKEKGATDSEIEYASDLTDRLIDYLKEKEWGEPLLCFSGNGWHLNYHVDLENSKDIKNKLKVIYAGLAKRFVNEKSAFDSTVHNASRILRTYGTINQKGGRRSYSCEDETIIITKEIIINLYKELKPPKVKKHWVKPENKINGISTDGWDALLEVSNAGLYLSSPEREKHYISCPWKDLHSSTSEKDTVLWTDNKYGTFHCSHDHCSNRTIKDLKNVL